MPCSIHEMEALRSELTAKVVSVAADHANAMEAMEKQLLEAKAAHQAEIKERLTMEVELGRVTAAASIQGAYRAARSRSGLRQLSTGLMARTEQMELRLSAQSERVLVETKDGIQAMNEAHRAEIAALQTELEEAQASHEQEVERLHQAHAAEMSRSDTQKADWLAEVQGAMRRSVAAMESATATSDAEHKATVTSLEAALRRAEAEANQFRKEHAAEVEEKNRALSERQDSLDEQEVMKATVAQWKARAERALGVSQEKSVRITALEEERAGLLAQHQQEKEATRAAHKEELAKTEATRVDAVQGSAERLAEVQASHRRSVEAMEVAAVAAAEGHAEAIAALQTELQLDRFADKVALGGAACTLEMRWRGRQAALEAAEKARMGAVSRDCAAQIELLQRQHEEALAAMMERLRVEQGQSVRALESSHREELEAMQQKWQMGASLEKLTSSLATAQRRAEKISEKKTGRKSARAVGPPRVASIRRERHDPLWAKPAAVEDQRYHPRHSDAVLIGRGGSDGRNTLDANGRMEGRSAHDRSLAAAHDRSLAEAASPPRSNGRSPRRSGRASPGKSGRKKKPPASPSSPRRNGRRRRSPRKRASPSRGRAPTPSSEDGSERRAMFDEPTGVVSYVPDKVARKAMFDKMDINGNGKLRLGEIQRAVAQIYPGEDLNRATLQAYRAADHNGDGLIGRREFRMLLEYLVFYCNAWAQFRAFDKDKDRRLSEAEFVSGCKRLGFQITDAEAREDFHSIDTNHGGYVLFEEFCCWAGQRHLGETKQLWPKGRTPGSLASMPYDDFPEAYAREAEAEHSPSPGHASARDGDGGGTPPHWAETYSPSAGTPSDVSPAALSCAATAALVAPSAC